MRPTGDPVRRWVELQPGEDAAALFAEWDRAGRVPAGSVLLRHVGTSLGMTGTAGFVVLAGDGLGEPGTYPRLEALDGYRKVATVRVAGRMPDVVVMAPEGGAG